jgi:hypothetical protein
VGIALLAVLGLAPVTGGVPADAAGVPIDIGLSKAFVLAHGSAVDVPVTYHCPPRFGGTRGYAIVSIEVKQHLARGLVDGFDVGGDPDNLVCDGAVHMTRIVVTPFPAGSGPVLAFQADRSATVKASVLACDAAEEHCVQPQFTHDLRLHTAPAGDPANTPADAQATLLANGSVRLEVPHGCAAGMTGSVRVSGLAERIGQGRAAISAFQDPTRCTAARMRTTVHPSDLGFIDGIAYLVSDWSVCGPHTCTEGIATGTLRIER